MEKRCDHCMGTGIRWLTLDGGKKEQCGYCNGMGWINEPERDPYVLISSGPKNTQSRPKAKLDDEITWGEVYKRSIAFLSLIIAGLVGFEVFNETAPDWLPPLAIAGLAYGITFLLGILMGKVLRVALPWLFIFGFFVLLIATFMENS